MTIPVSVMVLTKNEEQDLPACLESVSWSEDIHVLDSYSDDKTVEIAKSFGAKITQRVYDNAADHQNWAMENIDFKYPWVFYIDADERMTPGLVESVHKAVLSDSDIVSYSVQRRDFMGRTWLKHVQASSHYQRLFKPSLMRYLRPVNPINLPGGPVGVLTGYLDHYPFSKGIGHFINRHNAYSSFEAQQVIENRLKKSTFSVSKALTSKDFHERRFHLKEIYYRMPGRPFIKFFYMYVVKGGFLDGSAGLTYALLIFSYEWTIVMKLKELEQKQSRQKQKNPKLADTKD